MAEDKTRSAKIGAKAWLFIILAAAGAFSLWLRLGYPQFSFVKLKVSKAGALGITDAYLRSMGQIPSGFRHSVTFEVDTWADRYLQKTLGFGAEDNFVRRYNYDFFYWKVRYFRELQKEEFRFELSPRDGSILTYEHVIEDIASRPAILKVDARRRAEEFLAGFPGIHLADYVFHEEKERKFDKRTNYTFSWERKGVYIPWQKNQGGAKLLTTVTVSGEEILGFCLASLDVPEQFRRSITKALSFGDYLASFYFIIFISMVVAAMSLVLRRKDSFVCRFTQRWYVSLALFLLVANIFSLANNSNQLAMSYPTSVSFASFFWLNLLQLIIDLAVTSVAFIIPGIAGELLRAEVSPRQDQGGFLHNLRSSFLTRNLAQGVFYGYLFFFVILGVQTGIFFLGQKYFGVWREWFRFTQASSTYLPFFTGFVVAANASLTEETVFRLFGINWGKKFLKNTAAAVVFTALAWGLGHSNYAVFPVWFRGIEVGVLGMLMGLVYVRYGIIPVLAAHYAFDVYWVLVVYLLGKASPGLFWGSLSVFFLPFVFALIAYWRNRPEKESELILDARQMFNAEVLRAYCLKEKQGGTDRLVLRRNLLAHSWDEDIVDSVLKEVFHQETERK